MKETPDIDIAVCFGSFANAGTERVMISVANGLADIGCRVSIAVLRDEGELRSAVSPQIEIIDLGASSLRYRSSLTPLIGYFRHHAPDVFICALYTEPALIARMLTRNSCRFISTVHLSSRAFIAQGGARPMSMKIAAFLSRLVGNRSDAVVTVARTLEEEVAASGIDRKKIHTIYNPVVRPDMAQKLLETVDHPWYADRSKKLIFTAGRLEVQKDHDTLIRSFAKVREQIDARLLIAGGGSLREQTQALIDRLGLADCVQLLGPVPNVLPYMAGADLFALSSVAEGLPTVLIENMYCGTPIVSTNCPTGPDEILDGGRYGDLVPVRDVDALADAMIKNLREPKVSSDTLKARAMEFTVEIAAQKYLRLINDIMI